MFLYKNLNLIKNEILNFKLKMKNKNSINTIDIDENKLQNFDFESIIALEELITYFFNGKIKLKKNNYILNKTNENKKGIPFFPFSKKRKKK